ncbi:MAG: exodeoxyribonuclease VII large subunit [Desulfobulbus sp.]|nr:exodeoxyribonuclease VII large subunit [Desulfobulbus sp.]
MDDRRILTVSELNSSIRSLLEARFPFISVAGEISNLHRPYSGHNYFTLKDSGAQIKAVLFKPQQRYLARPIKDGDHVVCRGRISVYEPRGDYQLIVDTVEYQGAGALQQAFEQLKRRLAAEGLFDEHLKRPLPQFPQHIALITSPQGAAVHDFIRIATRRWPAMRISVYPVAVQGDPAAGEMIRALAEINRKLQPEIIVLCRGGGSIEDLWCFNDEHLARAIRSSAIPVVSAVGHEIDFTIADFAADLRAPTPSAAAELITPDSQVIERNLQQTKNRLTRSLRHHLASAGQQLQLIAQRLQAMPHPLDRLMLRLDHQTSRLHSALRQELSHQGRRLESATLQLARQSPAHRLELCQQRLQTAQDRFLQRMHQQLQEQEDRLARAAGILHAVSPLATLARGYAIVRTTGKRPCFIRQSTQINQGDKVEAMLHRGRLLCRVEQVIEDKGGDGD